jgi:hypothetical protein
MKQKFQEYLAKQGYSVTTPSGNPSTVYDYAKRIDRVCEWENTTWAGLAKNIGTIVTQYDTGGGKEHLGKKSNSAVINALKRFSEFLSA